MHGVTPREHHEVRDVDDVGDRPHAERLQAVLRRGRRHDGDVDDGSGAVVGAAFGILDGDVVVPMRRLIGGLVKRGHPRTVAASEDVVRRIARMQMLEPPAEQAAIERLRALDLRRGEISPAERPR